MPGQFITLLWLTGALSVIYFFSLVRNSFAQINDIQCKMFKI